MDNLQPHPLLQPVIVKCVFDMMPKSSWTTCRLVCKTWLGVLLPRWRNEMRVCVANMAPFSRSCLLEEVDRRESCLNMPKLLRNHYDVLQLDLIPFRVMDTFPGEVTIGCGRDQRDYWELFGHYLHHLCLCKVLISDQTLFKKLLFELTPNLKSLEITGCLVRKKLASAFNPDSVDYTPVDTPQRNLKRFRYCSTRDYKDYFNQLPVSWMDMFSHFLNLEEVLIKDLDGQTFIKLIDAIATIRNAHGHTVLNIKTWDTSDSEIGLNLLQNCVENSFTGLITEFNNLHVPVVELNVAVDQSWTPDHVLQLIDGHEQTLRKLSFVNHTQFPVHSFVDFPFEIFPEGLLEVALKGQVFYYLDFLTFTPNLAALIVEKERFLNLALLPPNLMIKNGPIFENLTTFKYGFCEREVVPVALVKKFVRLMPFVTCLALNVDSRGFGVVCSSWTKLKLWELGYATISEVVFINHIRKLKDLETLKFDRLNWHDPLTSNRMVSNFKLLSIKEGLLKLPRLHCLHMAFSLDIHTKDIPEKDYLVLTKLMFNVLDSDSRKNVVFLVRDGACLFSYIVFMRNNLNQNAKSAGLV